MSKWRNPDVIFTAGVVMVWHKFNCNNERFQQEEERGRKETKKFVPLPASYSCTGEIFGTLWRNKGFSNYTTHGKRTIAQGIIGSEWRYHCAQPTPKPPSPDNVSSCLNKHSFLQFSLLIPSGNSQSEKETLRGRQQSQEQPRSHVNKNYTHVFSNLRKWQWFFRNSSLENKIGEDIFGALV